MILKFDHISFSCDKEKDYRASIPEGYREIFAEMGLPNTECKRSFLSNWQDVHNIIMLESESGIPIEVTQYKTVSGESKLSLYQNEIHIPTPNILSSVSYFLCLGLKVLKQGETDAVLGLRPFLDKDEFLIYLKQGSSPPFPFLDVMGYSSIGLFVGRIDKEADKLRKAGYMVTQPSALTVNRKLLEIVFSHGGSGEIVELIAIGKGK